tara:strand:- start:221 stop:1609 length:1389 start_codon:yes stop_codon:yes gene_type:complete
MTREAINIGIVANDGTGDSFRVAGQKINNNFVELYTSFDATELFDYISIDGNNISATRSNDNINIIPAGTGVVTMPSLSIDGSINFVDNVISTVGNSDINFIPNGTGSVVLGDISVRHNTVTTNTSNADLQLSANSTGSISFLSDTTVNGNLSTATVSQGTGEFDTSLTLATGATVTGIDNGALGSSATLLATQGAIKTYVDAQVTAQDLDFATDDSTALSIDLDSESLQFSGGTGITTAGSGNTITTAVDSTVTTLTGSQTLTNKTLTAPTINSAAISSTPSMTQLNTETMAITDNTIQTTASNADLELSAAGTGQVRIDGFSLPRADNGSVQGLKTDGSGVLSFVSIDYPLNYTQLADGTVTLSSSATANVDTFDKTVHRSSRVVMSISDATNSRYEILEAVVTHNGSTAYVSDYGSTTNYTDSLLTLSADISGDTVRLRATPISSDSTVIKFLARRQVI